jgi:hypothetical protein
MPDQGAVATRCAQACATTSRCGNLAFRNLLRVLSGYPACPVTGIPRLLPVADNSSSRVVNLRG